MIRYTRAARALAICLAGVAGFADAVGFLQSGGLFVSFMSGNSTRLAVGLATAAPVAGLAAWLIGSFVIGVVLGSLIAARWPGRRKALVLAAMAVLLALAAGIEGLGWPWLMLAPLAMAMGCANNAFQRDGDVTIGVTYMTGALVRMGQRIADALRGGARWDWLPFLLLWAGLVTGAVAGALSFARFGASCLWGAVLAAAALSLWGWRLQLRDGR